MKTTTEWVVATGEDATEWSRHATKAEAIAEAIAESRRRRGEVSLWDEFEFDGDGNGPGPAATWRSGHLETEVQS